VTHIEGEVNPVSDLDTIAEELRLKDEEVLMTNLEKLERTVVRGNDKKMKPEYVRHLRGGDDACYARFMQQSSHRRRAGCIILVQQNRRCKR
jgi:ribosome-binding ATPase YchF (GTP1/OBG family)